MIDELIDRNCCIGRGISRNVYKSLIPGYVIKEDNNGGSQTFSESEIFKSMTLEEKEVFPVVAVEENRIMMRLVLVLEDFIYDDELDVLSDDDLEDEDVLFNFCEHYNIDVESVNKYLSFISKYDIRDLHTGNVGILDNKLVIIDAGSSSSNSHEIWG